MKAATVVDRCLDAIGFDSQDPEARECFAPAVALAVAMAALPFLILVLIDTDRSLSLAFLPAVWLARKISRPAAPIDLLLFGWAIAAMIIAAVFAPYMPRALVMTAAVGCTFSGALTSRKAAGSVNAVRMILWGITAGAVAGVVLVRLGVGAGSIFFPVYWSARLFGAHEFVGCLAVLGLLRVPQTNRSVRLLVITAAVIIWTGFAWSGSRAPVLGLVTSLLLWFWRGPKQDRCFLLRWVPALAVASLVLSYPLGNPYPQLGWWDAFSRTTGATGLESVTSERSVFWVATWRHALESPWIGHGADNYLYIHPAQLGNQPHNVLLQWFLEYGLLGTLPLVGLILRGVSKAPTGDGGLEVRSFDPVMWAKSCLAGAAVYGLFEGVFYHMIVFMPVAVIAGFAFHPGKSMRPTRKWARLTGNSLLAACLAFLLLHNWLCFQLLKNRDVEPDSLPARILRRFPSTTYALPNWINRWRATKPDIAMEWTKWAENVATDQAAYHVRAAQEYLWSKNYKAAEAELLMCLDKVTSIERQDVLDVLAKVRRREAEAHNATDLTR